MQPFTLLSEAATGSAGINPNTPVFQRRQFEYEETTLQVPFGEFSILEELKAGKVKPIEAIVTLTLGYRSNWTSGLTWKTSERMLAEVMQQDPNPLSINRVQMDPKNYLRRLPMLNQALESYESTNPDIVVLYRSSRQDPML